MDIMRLSLEYECHPIWVILPNGSLDNINPDTLQISNSLKNDINKWNKIFQATLDQSYPPNSGFSSEKADIFLWKSFQIEGFSIFLRLKEELSGIYELTSKQYSSKME